VILVARTVRLPDSLLTGCQKKTGAWPQLNNSLIFCHFSTISVDLVADDDRFITNEIILQILCKICLLYLFICMKNPKQFLCVFLLFSYKIYGNCWSYSVFNVVTCYAFFQILYMPWLEYKFIRAVLIFECIAGGIVLWLTC